MKVVLLTIALAIASMAAKIDPWAPSDKIDSKFLPIRLTEDMWFEKVVQGGKA